MVNFPNELELFHIVYIKNKTNKEIKIAVTQIDSHNETTPLVYFHRDNPFDQNRISGSLNIINGNGTVIFELKNLEYDEDGVFTLEMLEIFKSEKLGINVTSI